MAGSAPGDLYSQYFPCFFRLLLHGQGALGLLAPSWVCCSIRQFVSCYLLSSMAV